MSEVPERSRADQFVVWVAQGFGVGRLKPAPGTWGSLLGLGWTALLLLPESFLAYVIGVLIGIGLSVWICGRAEILLGEKDPGSVVLDEIAAVPVCFLLAEFVLCRLPHGNHLKTSDLWEDGIWGMWPTLVLFLSFRLFDIWKPWPVRQSQSLPGGWGVTVDDLLAALYVNLVSLPFLR